MVLRVDGEIISNKGPGNRGWIQRDLKDEGRTLASCFTAAGYIGPITIRRPQSDTKPGLTTQASQHKPSAAS